MNKVNPLKLTLVIIPLAIVLTLIDRFLINAALAPFGQTLHPAFTLVIYIIMFAILKIIGERMVKSGKYPWFLS